MKMSIYEDIEQFIFFPFLLVFLAFLHPEKIFLRQGIFTNRGKVMCSLLEFYPSSFFFFLLLISKCQMDRIFSIFFIFLELLKNYEKD